MVYDNAIPQANDDPSQSQGQILGNFQELDTFLSVNHVELNDANQGKHTFLQMPEQASAPTTAANELGIYTKEYNSLATLFFREESSGTEHILAGPPLLAASGYTYLPGGLLMQWNTVTASSQSSITFPVAFGANAYYVNFVVRGGSTNRVYTRIEGTPSAVNFTPVILNKDGGGITSTINYIAIGQVA